MTSVLSMNTLPYDCPYFGTIEAFQKILTAFFWDIEELQSVRNQTVGVFSVASFTYTEEKMAKYIHADDSIVRDISWTKSIHNDLFGGPRDQVGKDYAPHSQYNHLIGQGLDPASVVRTVAQQVNARIYHTDKFIQNMHSDRRPYFEYYEIVRDKFLEYHLASSTNFTNDRYGLVPIIENEV